MGFKVCKVFQIREDSTYFVIQFVIYLYIVTICKLFLLVFPLKEKESGKKFFFPLDNPGEKNIIKPLTPL